MGMPFQVQLIDVFSLILSLRVIYSAVTAKIVREFWKVMGLLLGMLAAFHFYSFLSEKGADIPFLNARYLNLFSFLTIFLSLRALFGFVGLITSLFFKKEEASGQKWVALASGCFRSITLISVMLFILQLSPLDPKHYINSFSYKVCNRVGPETYLFLMKAFPDQEAEYFKVNEDFYQQYKGPRNTLIK
jgi:hypothetical protein